MGRRPAVEGALHPLPAAVWNVGVDHGVTPISTEQLRLSRARMRALPRQYCMLPLLAQSPLGTNGIRIDAPILY